jgi:hypothetical protein
MVTDLGRALRGAVDSPPPAALDLAGVVTAGQRRVRRRRLTVAVAAATATGVAAASVIAVLAWPDHAGRSEPPLPTSPMTLKRANAAPAETAPLYSVENYHPGRGFDRDRVNGVTDDGLVARVQFDENYGVDRFGLLDPATGQTTWLPKTRIYLHRPEAVQLGTDRLVYVDVASDPSRIVVFDRARQTWSTPQIQVPPGTRGLGPYLGEGAVIGGNRLYFPTSDGSWWSVLLSTGGDARQQPAWPALAFAGSVKATVDLSGHLEVTDNGHHVFSADPPAGCAPPAVGSTMPYANGSDIGSQVMFAGSRPVVGYYCAGGVRTVVYDDQGRPAITLGPGVGPPVAADDRFVLLDGNTDPHGTTDDTTLYVLDLTRWQLRTLPAPRDGNVAPWLSGSLASWDTAGTHDDKNSYDVVYRVDHLE